MYIAAACNVSTASAAVGLIRGLGFRHLHGSTGSEQIQSVTLECIQVTLVQCLCVELREKAAPCGDPIDTKHAP